MISRFFKLNETYLCDINWDGLVLVGIELGELVEGLHGELFWGLGLLGGPSPRAAPALLAALGAGCSPVYSATHRRTPVHHQASTLHQCKWHQRPGAGGGALVQMQPVQNQKCSWTRFAQVVSAPTTLILQHIATYWSHWLSAAQRAQCFTKK